MQGVDSVPGRLSPAHSSDYAEHEEMAKIHSKVIICQLIMYVSVNFAYIKILGNQLLKNVNLFSEKICIMC